MSDHEIHQSLERSATSTRLAVAVVDHDPCQSFF
jgi:hypothetical protein